MSFQHVLTNRIVYITTSAGVLHCRGSRWWKQA